MPSDKHEDTAESKVLKRSGDRDCRDCNKWSTWSIQGDCAALRSVVQTSGSQPKESCEVSASDVHL